MKSLESSSHATRARTRFAPARDTKVPFVTNQDVRISYDVTGRGPPLVLHHGFAQCSNDWHRVGYLEQLVANHMVILVDARGHGNSDKPHEKAAYRWPVQVFDVIAVLDELELSKAAYWGYSMGGDFGFGVAVYAPDRLSALLCGGASAQGSDMGTAFRDIDGTDPDAFVERLAARTAASPPEGDARKRLLENDLQALAAAAQDRPSLEHMMCTLNMPCFIYAGGADKDLAQARSSAARIPQASFTVFPDMDHGETFDRSDIVLPKALDFLQHAS
jgi:pimeloyl-ACP methyl ester carboxylesterase